MKRSERIDMKISHAIRNVQDKGAIFILRARLQTRRHRYQQLRIQIKGIKKKYTQTSRVNVYVCFMLCFKKTLYKTFIHIGTYICLVQLAIHTYRSVMAGLKPKFCRYLWISLICRRGSTKTFQMTVKHRKPKHLLRFRSKSLIVLLTAIRCTKSCSICPMCTQPFQVIVWVLSALLVQMSRKISSIFFSIICKNMKSEPVFVPNTKHRMVYQLGGLFYHYSLTKEKWCSCNILEISKQFIL